MAVTAETDMYTGEKHSAIAGKPSTHSLQRRIDLRCEDTLSVYRDPLENPLVQPVSVMDHTRACGLIWRKRNQDGLPWIRQTGRQMKRVV